MGHQELPPTKRGSPFKQLQTVVLSPPYNDRRSPTSVPTTTYNMLLSCRGCCFRFYSNHESSFLGLDIFRTRYGDE